MGTEYVVLGHLLGRPVQTAETEMTKNSLLRLIYPLVF